MIIRQTTNSGTDPVIIIGGTHRKTKLTWGGPEVTFLIGSPVSERPQGSSLVDSFGLIMESLFSLSLSTLSIILPEDVPSSIYCGTLRLFDPAAGWKLSEDNYTKMLSASITECH